MDDMNQNNQNPQPQPPQNEERPNTYEPIPAEAAYTQPQTTQYQQLYNNEPQQSNYAPYSSSYQYTPPEQRHIPQKRGLHGSAIVAICICCVLMGSLVGIIAYRAINADAAPFLRADATATALPLQTPGVAFNPGNDNKHFSLESAAALPNQDGKIALSLTQIYEKLSPAIVYINTETTIPESYFSRGYTVPAAGSGIVISQDGYILTNNHVVEGAEKMVVGFENGMEYQAVLVGRDAKTDIAVIKIDMTGLPAVTLGDSDTVQVGELAVAIGNPLGEFSGSITAGIISALNRNITIGGVTMSLLQTDAAVNEGNSGGALINSYGEVIGVVTAKTEAVGVEGLGFAIPISDVKDVIEDLINQGYVERPAIGIEHKDITQSISQAYSLPLGIYVINVLPDGGAAKAGLRQYDIITGVDGKPITTGYELQQEISARQIGDTIRLSITRSGQQMEVDVQLSSSSILG